MSEVRRPATAQEWEITVTRISSYNAGELENFRVPYNQISRTALVGLLKALMAKYSESDGKVIATHFINGRKGRLGRSKGWELRSFSDLEKKRHGYVCADPPFFAVASLPLTDREVTFLRANIEVSGNV